MPPPSEGGDTFSPSSSLGDCATSATMVLLPQRVVAVARDLGDLDLMRAVRVALQRATFSSIGLSIG